MLSNCGLHQYHFNANKYKDVHYVNKVITSLPTHCHNITRTYCHCKLTVMLLCYASHQYHQIKSHIYDYNLRLFFSTIFTYFTEKIVNSYFARQKNTRIVNFAADTSE